jgi:hypothetical protein
MTEQERREKQAAFEAIMALWTQVPLAEVRRFYEARGCGSERMADLTEVSLLELRAQVLRERGAYATKPCRLTITPEGLAYCRELAATDPEFARRVRAEFPDMADVLLGPDIP